MINIDHLVNELSLVDHHFGLPDNTTRGAIVDHKYDCVVRLRKHLSSHNIEIDDNAIIPIASRSAWASLMRLLGINRVWWMSDMCHAIDLHDEIKTV